MKRLTALAACLLLWTTAVVADPRPVTVLFTNDFESAYDPTFAWWRDDIERIGGIAHLATLIEQIRSGEETVFLFDAGDIFTGTLSRLTGGVLPFELMITLDYDAMAVGNHEFEYGWQRFAEVKHRAPFPVLGANLFYRGTDIPFAQPYAVVERNGIRVGVIGILGQDAATALIPSNIAGVEVRDPRPIVAELVAMLRPDVDLVVLLTHQGKTAPMQTDDEARPDIRRDIDADIELAGVTDGIDLLLAGHADAGTPEPVVHPQTGTLIMQTWGQGQHLGRLDLELDGASGDIAAATGRLVTVDSNALAPHAGVQAKLARYRAMFPGYYAVIATANDHLTRRYNLESDLGNLFADVLRDAAGTTIGLVPSGALRKDISAGDVRVIDLLDAFPFTDRIAIVELTGAGLIDVIEQGLSLERGILQVSGLEIRYDPGLPAGSRLLGIRAGGAEVDPNASYEVATLEILAEGGDRYEQFRAGRLLDMPDEAFGDVLRRWFERQESIAVPARGRLVAVPR